jgi:DNA-binding transcriptional MerR regulator
MGQYSIKEVEILSGVKAHTLRIWEQRYDFLKPKRTDTNIRYYDDDQLKLILNIGMLNRSGMRISKIANLDKDELNKEVQKLSQDDAQPNVHLDALTHAMIDFDEARFEKTLSGAVMRQGFDKTFTELIFPLLVRTGVLWSTGVIHPSQEHFISNLIRRKLCAAIDAQYVELRPDTKRFLLFLPEGENHELVLLFVEYILRKNNHHVAYIGNSVPYEDIGFINETFKPDYLVTHFSIPLPHETLQEYIDKLSGAFPGQQIIIGGKQVETQQPHLPDNVHSITSIEELIGIVI